MLAGQEYRLFTLLMQTYGKQDWWPADSVTEVMLGAILTQNTAWTNVEKALANLKQQGLLNISELVQASQDTVAELIRPSGYFNVKARRLHAFCQWYEQQGGFDALDRLQTEHLRTSLLDVHGIGPETADDILLYGFKRPVFVIDTYTRRLFARTGLADGNEPYDVLRLQVEQALAGNTEDLNEFHALIVRHAKVYCRKQPLCRECIVHRECEHGLQLNAQAAGN